MRTFVTFVGGDFKLPGCLLWITQRLKLDGAIGQGEIRNSLKSENF